MQEKTCGHRTESAQLSGNSHHIVLREEGCLLLAAWRALLLRCEQTGLVLIMMKVNCYLSCA